ncbi:mannose-6-phosphate isomerase, class I [Lentibacillus sediminis]|uniref:mannose-6-phosphate isomerase, class I n=1 Tax=Lentibacillus sediminis TaxID=1940529 RepID=UPI000C1C27CA|nr:mannose-6-phosphate isomerase, class I [Lentibacillus sediminis]
MNKQPIFLQPVFQERIWGGQKLHTDYDYDVPFEKTGEAWVISAHPNGPSTITNGMLKGKTLKDAWEEHGELFNKKKETDEEYPLLVKMLDANDDLSVQVHPDDQFAREIEGQPYGKTECWYVLEAEPGAELILGHHAVTREELEKMMDSGQWGDLLQRVPVTAGDFFYVPSGTIHAIGKGIVILETQQSSDITYRVYDYDRTDAKGEKRELHLERAKQVTTVPHQPAHTEQEERVNGGLTEKRLVEADYFCVAHWQLDGSVSRKLTEDFLQVSVISGQAELTAGEESYHLEKGMHFILPHQTGEYSLDGSAQFVVSWTP